MYYCSRIQSMKQLTKEELSRKKSFQRWDRSMPFFILTGVEHLEFQKGQTWKDRIKCLLREASVPLFYVSHLYSPEYLKVYPNTVYIYTQNRWLVRHCKHKLSKCLANSYSPRTFCL